MKTQNFPFIFSDVNKLPDDIQTKLLNPDLGTEQHDGETKMKKKKKKKKSKMTMNPLKHLQPMSNKRFLNFLIKQWPTVFITSCNVTNIFIIHRVTVYINQNTIVIIYF